MAKDRGLKEAKEYLGNIEKIISDRLNKKKTVKILEIGCGYGRVMVELKKKFGEKIEIIGMNLLPEHGDLKIMTKLIILNEAITKEELETFKLPKIIYGDAGEKIPFKDKSIDFIYSQIATSYFSDKLHFLEEVARVLTKKGLARITFSFNKSKGAEELRPLLRIYKDGKSIKPSKFLKSFKYIKRVTAPGGKCIEVKSGNLKFNATLVSTLNLRDVSDIYGVQSIYSLETFRHTCTK
jgi:ubiquinone/menaquinone biosynthesis C-methylase UbiE